MKFLSKRNLENPFFWSFSRSPVHWALAALTGVRQTKSVAPTNPYGKNRRAKITLFFAATFG
jgi:hypothetical protein